MTLPADIEHREQVFIPVAVDAERLIDGVRLLRATYFLVTTESPRSIWEIELPGVARLHGLGALGMSGVVFSPLRRTEVAGRELTSYDLFIDAADISAIFALEEAGFVSIQLEDIWLPHFWCREAAVWGGDGTDGSDVERGDVFRVSARLFPQAYRYATGELDLDGLLDLRVEGQLFRSHAETQALRDWAQLQIEEAKRAFAAKEVKLRVRAR